MFTSINKPVIKGTHSDLSHFQHSLLILTTFPMSELVSSPPLSVLWSWFRTKQEMHPLVERAPPAKVVMNMGFQSSCSNMIPLTLQVVDLWQIPALSPCVCSKRGGKRMMKRGRASHQGRFSPAQLLARLTAPCLCPRTAAIAETCCKGGLTEPPQPEQD